MSPALASTLNRDGAMTLAAWSRPEVQLCILACLLAPSRKEHDDKGAFQGRVRSYQNPQTLMLPAAVATPAGSENWSL